MATHDTRRHFQSIGRVRDDAGLPMPAQLARMEGRQLRPTGKAVKATVAYLTKHDDAGVTVRDCAIRFGLTMPCARARLEMCIEAGLAAKVGPDNAEVYRSLRAA